METDCFMCNAASAAYRSELPWYDKPLFENDLAIAILGTGAIAPGYVLVCPSAHVHSLASIHPDNRATFVEMVNTVSAALQATFGPAVVFEHGGCTSDSRRSQCVSHAHLHMWSVGDRVRLSGWRDEQEFPTLGAFLEASAPYKRDGYLLRGHTASIVVGPDPGVSQYFRRQVAAGLGRPDEWDYAISMCSGNMILTRDALSIGIQR